VQDKWEDFLTLSAYELILANDDKKICITIDDKTTTTGSPILVNLDKEKAG
jgi:hypothetical protein